MTKGQTQEFPRAAKLRSRSHDAEGAVKEAGNEPSGPGCICSFKN